MRRSRVFLLLLAAASLAMSGCDGGTEPPATGEVRGMVVVEGDGLPGVTVELSGAERREVTTDETGRFAFDDVPVGAWVVSIRGFPVDASFGVTSKPAVISRETTRRTVTVDFSGNFIRTSSVGGRVRSGERPLQGVSVRIAGPDTVETTTDAEGRYAMGGLRRGTYAVELQNPPGSVTFPSTRIEVQVDVGESVVVDFEGEPEVTATLYIAALRRRLPSGDRESVDPDDVRGRVEVVVTVDRGEDTPEAVAVYLDDEKVGEQRFTSGGAPAAGHEAGAGRVALQGDPAAAPFDLVFTVNTEEFDPETGEVRFQNGPRVLEARLSTREAGEDVWTAELPVTLRNPDRFVGELLPERGPVPGEDGQEWIGGDVGVRVTPVLFNADRTVGQITVELRRSGGGALRERSVGGTPPFMLVFPGDGEPSSTNVVEYQTPAGETDELRVRSALYADGTSLPAMPVSVATELRLDNLPPPGGSFRLPSQDAERDCCLGNWVGAGFPFVDAVAAEPDEGVGGGTVTTHAGPASESEEELAARAPVESGADLPASATNGEYSAVAVIRDALDNRRLVRLEPSDGNSFANERGGVFGVDRGEPQVRFSSGSLPHRAVNPSSDAEWEVRAEDDLSAFSSLPARTTVGLLAPGVDGSEACPFPGTSDCLPSPDGLSRSVPTSGDGYLIYRTRVLDRAGNASRQLDAWALRDSSPPVVEALEEPAAYPAGETVTLRAPASDDVDLHRARSLLRFAPAGGVEAEEMAFALPDTLGRRFDGSPVDAATAEWQVPVVAAMERADAGGEEGGNAPSETLRELAALAVTVADAAGNLDRLDEAVTVSSSAPTSFAVAVRGTEDGVAQWEPGADGSSVCAPRSDLENGGSCSAAPATLELHATARGEGGVFEPPFTAVHFYARVGGDIRWLGRVDAEELLEDGNGPAARAWRWTLPWTPEADFPAGVHSLFAVGLDGAGNALQTVDLTGIQVVEAN